MIIEYLHARSYKLTISNYFQFAVRWGVFGAFGNAIATGICLSLLFRISAGRNGRITWKFARITRRRVQTVFRASTTLRTQSFKYRYMASKWEK